jgi:hypothetical protein
VFRTPKPKVTGSSLVGQTEEWLRRHDARFGHFAMGPWGSLSNRRKNIDKFKAYGLKNSTC